MRLMLPAAVLAAFFFSLPAWAVPMACGPRDDVLEQLWTKFKERPVQIGIANNGGLVELLTSPHGETWTLVISMPNGPACLIAAGEDWGGALPVDEGAI